jgi:ribosomal-protein-alanine N-acetyltransferase
VSAQLRESWSIAPMSQASLAAVLEIERRAYPYPWTESIFRDCLRAGYSAWLLICSDGSLAGYALMSMAVGEAHVLNLCVDPGYQRRGLGLMMLHHLLGLARAANCTIVLLEVRKSNKAAQRLYESIGFQRLGVRKNYYPAQDCREDALVLGYDIV